jgi:lysine-specific histone demethylase 1
MNASVCIIGAGISGIHAAKSLEKLAAIHGFKITLKILEAKSKPGGRTSSTQFGDVSIDFGATWMEGIGNNPLFDLAQSYDLIPKPVNSQNYVYHNGSIADSFKDHVFGNKFEKILEGGLSIKSKDDMSLYDAMQKYMTINKIEIKDHEKSLFDAQIQSLQGYNGCLLTELSTKSYSTDNGFKGDSIYMAGKFGKLVEEYAEGLPISCNQIVRDVDYSSESKIVIATTDETVYTADFVICTIPIGCLKKNTIRFVPELPIEKIHAIERIGFGVLDKVHIEFPEIFWEKNAGWIEIHSTSVDFRSFLCVPGSPVLIGFINSEFAKQMEELTDEQVGEKACAVLKTVFGEKVTDPIRFQMNRWWTDPFSYGSYTHFKIGNIAKDYDIVGTPLQDRLFFAGEGAISRGCSFVNGGYLSGERVANRIIEILKKRK